MRVKYRRFSTEEKADAFIARLNTLYGYPKPETHTFTIAEAIVHPQTGHAIVVLKPVFDHNKGRYSNMALRLTKEEKANSTEMVDPDLVAEGFETSRSSRRQGHQDTET